MKVILKDGKEIEFKSGANALDIAQIISPQLASRAVACRINGSLFGLTQKLPDKAQLEIVTFEDEDGKDVYRHTTAHIMAQAVKKIFPTCMLAIGPSIKNGFYYDFDFKTAITNDDLVKIEQEMQSIINADFPIERIEVARRTAQTKMRNLGEDYKLQILDALPQGTKISFYKQGDFIDLCQGPHLPRTGRIKFFKLTSIAGAYWKGDEKNKMLTRIYGTAFEKKSQLEDYLNSIEEAKKRDHNKLGRELGIFMTDENIGQGLPLLMPKGAKIMQILQRFVEDEEAKRGYLLTKTPIMAKNNLYKISGHWQHYRDGMFVLGKEGEDEEIFALRPMTCPFQFSIYNNGLKSYRDLPLRYGETATLYRNENSGEMHGLIRVRQFTLSDGHIICTKEQIEQEFLEALDITYFILKALGLSEDASFRFSKWDPKKTDKYIDNPEAWEETQAIMKRILDKIGLKYTEADGEAAFYGPKLDIQMRNVWGKEDTLITIQIDFALAERFGMEYIDVDGKKQRPFIIHRSSIGCYERTLALLIEKYAGAFPVWMSHIQAVVMSLTDRTAEDAKEIANTLLEHGLRVTVDNRSEKIGYKIREATSDKIPYMLIIGDKEKQNNTVSVRSRKDGDLGAMSLADFIDRIKKDIKEFN